MEKTNISGFPSTRASVAALLSTCLSITLFTASMRVVRAQQSAGQPQQRRAPEALSTTPPTQNASVTAPSSASPNDRYLIGPGDVLDIRVFNHPQLSRDAVRVDGRGIISMPMIEDEIQAACRTESELAREIVTRYRRYQRHPYVDVFVKEYQSRPVAVIGAVNKPGRFQLQRRVRLLELLSFAEGPAERAGGRVQITRTAGGEACDLHASTVSDTDALEGIISFDLKDTLHGDDKSNPYVQPGDVISLPDAEQAFVVGNVLRPLTIPLKEPVTVSRAVAMAGGTLPDTKSGKVRIIRQTPGRSTKGEIIVDLEAIDKRQAEDVGLQAGDIVDVPTSGGKRFLRGLVGTINPAISQLPIRVIQ